MTDQTKTEIPVLPDFDSMLKKDMVDHVMTFHHWFPDSKTTKETLISYHTERHEAMEHPEATTESLVARGWNRSRAEERVQRLTQAVRHTHSALAPTAEQQALLEAMKENPDYVAPDHPLSAAERKVLSTLVDNDFATAKNQLIREVNALRVAKRAEVAEEWAGRRAEADKFKARMEVLVQQAIDAARELINEAAINGITMSSPLAGYSPGNVRISVTGEAEAYSALEAQVTSQQTRALNMLEARRLAAQRQVLLMGITEESKKVLDTIPTAASVLQLTAQES